MNTYFTYSFRPDESALISLKARKKIMLRAILVITGSLSILALIYIFGATLLFPEMVTPDNENPIYTGTTILILGILLSIILYKKDAITPAIYVYLIMFGTMIVLSESLTEILYGRANILLLLLVVLAGVLLSSRAAYTITFIISILLIVGYVAIGWPLQKLPNVPAILILIFLAFLIEWPISFLEKAVKNLQNANEQLQKVSQQLLEVQEREKHALALELHDDIGQSLTSLKMMLELAENLPTAERKKKDGGCQRTGLRDDEESAQPFA